MANWGPDTNTSHFSILVAPAPHLDGKYVIFGEVVRGKKALLLSLFCGLLASAEIRFVFLFGGKGMEIAMEINSYAKGKKENTAGPEVKAVVVDAGQCATPECP